MLGTVFPVCLAMLLWETHNAFANLHMVLAEGLPGIPLVRWLQIQQPMLQMANCHFQRYGIPAVTQPALGLTFKR